VTRRVSSLWGRLPIPEPDFWRLWLVGAILFVTRWMDMLAMSVYVWQHTHSAFLVSLLMVLRFLPMSLLGLFLGDVADRFERRTLMLVVNLSLLVGAVALLLLELTGHLAVWHLMAASFLGGIATAADNPIRRLMMGQVVGSESFGKAMAIDVGTSNGTRTFGPFIAGLMMAAWGIESVFALDVAMYVASVAALWHVRCRNEARASTGEPVLKRLAEGWAICRASPKLMGTLLLTIYFNIFVYPYVSIVPVIGADNLHLDAAAIGILASMDGLGSLIGALFFGMTLRPPQFRRLYVNSIIAGHAILILFALATHVILSGMTLLALGIAIAGFSVTQNTLVFLLAPDHARARMMGLLSVSIGIGPIGFLIFGSLADAIGASHAAIVMAAIGLATIIMTKQYWRDLYARPN
jgi:MFS family permease